jgi:hypothetical protein
MPEREASIPPGFVLPGTEGGSKTALAADPHGRVGDKRRLAALAQNDAK